MKVFIQIGTNNGNDEFNSIVKYVCPDKIILVEPNSSLTGFIASNYANIENVYIENFAITTTTQGTVSLFMKNKLNLSGENEMGIRYDGGFSLLPMDDWGDDLDEIRAESISFDDLCKKHNVTNIRYLQIDTEGFDAEIIKSIDFNKINIDIIKYEKWNFSPHCFSRHGNKYMEYGLSGMESVEKLLKGKGYVLMEQQSDIIAIKL